MPNKLPIIVLISGYGGNLQAIIDAIEAKKLNAEIKAVISNKANAFGLIRAKQHGIPTVIHRPLDYLTRKDYDLAMANIIRVFKAELIILAGYMRILSPEFIQAYQGRILNVHPSLLPKYPGLDTHEQVISNQDPEHGMTIHVVNEKLDAGPILEQRKFKVTDYNPDSLVARVQSIEHQAYPEVIQRFATGALPLPYLI